MKKMATASTTQKTKAQKPRAQKSRAQKSRVQKTKAQILTVTLKTDCKPILQRKEKHMATENKMKRVFICSPFRGFGDSAEEQTRDCKRNIHNARAACNFAVMKGCVPYAPHLYFPQFLMDSDPDERKAGLLMGLTWLSYCDELWVIGRRISEGMENEINMAKKWGIPIIRYVGKRSPEERLLDAIFYPDIKFREMVISDEDFYDDYDEEEDLLYDGD